MQAGVGLLVSDVMPIYMIIPRYSHNYAQFCQLLNSSNLFTRREYLCSREKPLVKPMAPGSIFHHINLRDLLLFAFTFRSINPKTQKYIAALFIYLFYFVFCEIYLSKIIQINLYFYPGGIDNPSYASGCDTSILHHAFISIFTALWAVMPRYVTILMAILSYFTRFP